MKEDMPLDSLGWETKKYSCPQNNSPPFSVGEAGRMGGVKRRDIGHGALAERALTPMVPSIEEFPYSIRVVSDILESNGSSSMASVCGSSLSLMDAGVPIKRPVAGIAMGLIKEGDDYLVLTDVNDDGQVLIYSANGELGDALVERVRMMMKEVEVGDEYLGKVVKTTTFGAFIELAKGTDGLLHISNVSPGQRVESVDDVLSKGDEVNVRVVEVDRDRGRIGLRLAEDPDIAGKSVEELAALAAA